MNAPRLALLAAALSLAVAGCTRTLDTAKLDPLGKAEGFCQAKQDAHYQWNVRCSGYDPAYALIRPKYWYQAECAGQGQAVAGGRMTYDRAAAEACLAAYTRTDTCDEPRWTMPECLAAIAPAVPPGGECLGDSDCLAPSGCYSADGTCPGRCTSVAALDAPCGGAVGCQPGLRCGPSSTCQPRKRSGEACTGADCLENLTCDAGFCSYVAGVGEPCGVLACDPSQGTYCNGSCLPRPVQGEPCGPGQLCADGHYCSSVDSNCYRLPTAPVALGQPCAAPAFCAADAWCDTTLPTRICKARKAVGAPCQAADECLRPARCDTSGAPSEWRCAPPRVAGSACDLTTRPCSNGSSCRITTGTTGVCVTEADFGQACGAIGIGDPTYCGPGVCVGATPSDAVGICKPEGTGGAPCAQDQECASFSCDTVTGRCRPQPCPLYY